MESIPKSLQAMIADARHAVAHWDDDEQSPDDDVMDYVKDWTERLSRGEYDQGLYWQCVAEDCEADGDWDGAKAAYRRLVDLEADGQQHGFLSAHSDLAGLHSLLGELAPALEHARRATAIEERNPVTRIAFRCAIVQEARLLLRAKRLRAARRLIKRGLASFEEDCPDDLGYAKLAIVWAACDVAAGRADGADEWLQSAWSYLEAVREALEADVDGGADSASGLQGAYSMWWEVDAECRRLVGDVSSEVEAWEQAVTCSRRAAAGWDRIGWEASIMRGLRSLASAQQRQGHLAKASQSEAEAEAIRLRWRLPLVAPCELTANSDAASNWFSSLFGKRR